MMDKATLFLMIQTIILFSYKCSESRREIFWGLQINVLKVFPSRLIVSSHTTLQPGMVARMCGT